MTQAEHDAPGLSVVVPHYNDLQRLDTCLSALVQQAGAPPFEIVVADNNSPCGIEAVEAVVAGRARVVSQPEKGAGPARNKGIAEAKGHLLAFTDCDCVPSPGWLAAGLAALDQCDFAGGAMAVLVRDETDMTGAEAFERVFAFNNQRYVEVEGFTVTANLFAPRTVFDRIGLFRTGVSEDIEWCWRARAAGLKIGYAPDALVSHPARANWRELVGKQRRTNHERFLLACQQRRGRLRWLVRSLALPGSILAHAPRIFTSRALTGRSARMRALGTLICIRLWSTADTLSLLVRR